MMTTSSEVNCPVRSLVSKVATKVAVQLVKAKKAEKAQKAAKEQKAAAMKGTMKWLPFMSSFVLEKMCELIKSGVCTEKGFKEVHLTAVAKALQEHCGSEVSSTQMYNHLRK